MSRVARLGAFIFVTLTILAAGVFIIGSKEYLFRSTYQLKAQFDNVAGLAEGADVQVGGVHSGMVRNIVLPHKPGEQVTVIMDLNRSTHEIIKKDSVASIETAGVLGNQFIAISFGSSGQAEVRDGEIIASAPPLVLADLFKKTSGILDSSQQAINNATLATAHLNSVSAKIDSGQGTVGALVNDKQLYANLQQSTATLQATMLQAQMATAHLNSVSAKIDSGQGTVGALLNDKQLYANLQQSTATLQATMLQAQTGVTDFKENMEALKHNFFLSGYFKKRGYNDSGDLAANRVSGLPKGTPLQVFNYAAKELFDTSDSAKMKNKKSLNAGGEFLAQNPFGVAVVVVSTGTNGDTQKELVLSEARAMVIREYLVENYGFDDSQLKTLGMGKQTGANMDAEWGSIQILIFPVGTEIPTDKPVPVASSSAADAERPIQVTAVATQKS
ncbi:MAG TPA: MlaD family protein [Terracidiphilus sp.]|jgi:phospholipid/cholesterol/gamma-HCH transport system substrate-binding protein|nr:MlaD family protein [Terracidiphilus sp.]